MPEIERSMRRQPLRTEADYDKALKRAYILMDAKRGTLKGKELDALVTLIEAYEDKHYRIGRPGRPLIKFFRRSPLRGIGLKIKRSRETGRKPVKF